jgi:hypothetical protein
MELDPKEHTFLNREISYVTHHVVRNYTKLTSDIENQFLIKINTLLITIPNMFEWIHTEGKREFNNAKTEIHVLPLGQHVVQSSLIKP